MVDEGTKVGGKRAYVVLGVVVLATAGLIAYLVWPRTPDHVLIVGDSVTYMSWQDLDAAFGPGIALEPVARPGFRSSDLVPVVEEAIDDRAASGRTLDRAVFLVGYNDVWQAQLDDNGLRELVDLSARHECAVWLTIPARPGGEPPPAGDFDPDVADELNDLLGELVGEHPNLHLVDDWAEAIDGATDPDLYLGPDGIHPNEQGQKLLAETMHEAVMSACRFPELAR